MKVVPYFLLLGYFIFVGTDIFTHNIWHLFSTTEIDWYGDKWRICDIVYSIGKSFTFLLAYILFWAMFRYLSNIHKTNVLFIAEICSMNAIGLAVNDLFDELSGGKTRDTPIEWLIFVFTISVTCYRLRRLIVK